MEGVILDYNLETRAGVVRCLQGTRYSFALDDWKSSDLPQPGERVDFVPSGERAGNLYRLQSPVAAAALAPTPSPFAPPTAAPTQVPTPSVLAIISLIAGILGLIFFGSLIAVICGHIARANIRDSRGALTGDGLALAGLILGYLGLGLTLLVFLVMFLVAIAGATL